MRPHRMQRNGYSDLGRQKISLVPQITVLTDRADGSLWVVTFETSPKERIGITDLATYAVTNIIEGAKLYTAFRGPALDTTQVGGSFTLFVRSGRIGIDFRTFPVGEIDIDTPPAYARQKTSNDYRLINFDVANVSKIHLGYIAP